MVAAQSVVLVNGLWLNNLALQPLVWRLQHAGFRAYAFSYPSRREDLQANARGLQEFISSVPGEIVHCVGYSLGGMVLRALFRDYPNQRPGRVVLLGSPQTGSHVAQVLSRSRAGRWLTGRSVADLLAGAYREQPWFDREIGVIAGSRPLGLGRLVATLPGISDGTIQVEETKVPGARDTIVLPVAHSAMLWSPSVAEQVATFLRNGRFRR